ncbi:MAG: nuclear transport factor 2 family protein [Cyanobacteria bacterium]|nr:nuclear transport factor 2 family protein [Cyanobacteriota bacterium]
MTHPPAPLLIPPFTEETAYAKVKKAQALWNTKEPFQVVMAYTEDCLWRNRDESFQGHPAIIEFLTRKWQTELDYKLNKELFLFSANKIAVQFEYEWHDTNRHWFRSYGLEHWVFDPNGKMTSRTASINDKAINESERKYLI